jgi:formylglycine-generating enzyme required for sulfatase activity
VWIEGGWFHRGSDADALWEAQVLCRRDHPGMLGEQICDEQVFFAPETPASRVWVSAYGIDRTEVTHEAYDRCVRANRCPPPRTSARDPRVSQPNHPVSAVTWAEAQGYCAFVDGRLPTEAEWERAARGHDTRAFPWGNVYNPRLANHGGVMGRAEADDGFRHAAPVGSYPSAVSPFGLLDMAGNVWEWTADRWEPEAYRMYGRVDPIGPRTGGERVIRGGSWRAPAFQLRVTHRFLLAEGSSQPDVGFRCAYDRAR